MSIISLILRAASAYFTSAWVNWQTWITPGTVYYGSAKWFHAYLYDSLMWILDERSSYSVQNITGFSITLMLSQVYN
jgi:hypothetical protein